MALNKIKTAAFSMLSVGFVSVATAQPGVVPLLTGVVQAIDLANNVVVISGKTVSTADASRVVSGQAVNVYGTVAPDGRIVKAVLESAPTYFASSGKQSGVDVGAVNKAGISVGGDAVQGISVGGSEAQGISVGGSEVQGISVGGHQAEGISVGGAQVQGISVGGLRVEGISVGGRTSD